MEKNGEKEWERGNVRKNEIYVAKVETNLW